MAGGSQKILSNVFDWKENHLHAKYVHGRCIIIQNKSNETRNVNDIHTQNPLCVLIEWAYCKRQCPLSTTWYLYVVYIYRLNDRMRPLEFTRATVFVQQYPAVLHCVMALTCVMVSPEPYRNTCDICNFANRVKYQCWEIKCDSYTRPPFPNRNQVIFGDT